MVLYNILTHHYDKNTHYEFDNDAEDLFEEIIDNYNVQFNLKYSTSSSQISSSQPELTLQNVKKYLCVLKLQS